MSRRGDLCRNCKQRGHFWKQCPLVASPPPPIGFASSGPVVASAPPPVVVGTSPSPPVVSTPTHVANVSGRLEDAEVDVGAGRDVNVSGGRGRSLFGGGSGRPSFTTLRPLPKAHPDCECCQLLQGMLYASWFTEVDTPELDDKGPLGSSSVAYNSLPMPHPECRCCVEIRGMLFATWLKK